MTGFYKDYADSSDTHQNSAEASADAAESAKLIAQNAASTATAKAVEATSAAGQAATSASEAATSASEAATSLAAQEDLEVTSASFDTADGTLTLTKANSGTVTTDLDGRYADLSGADFTGNVTSTGTLATGGFTLPSTDGTDGQALITDGSGNVSFGDVTADVSGKADLSGATFTGDVTFNEKIEFQKGSFSSYPTIQHWQTKLGSSSVNGLFIDGEDRLNIRSSVYLDLKSYGNLLRLYGSSGYKFLECKLDSDGLKTTILYHGNSNEKLRTVSDGILVDSKVEAELFKGDLEGAIHFKGAVASGATLTKGDVVYVSGHSGQKTEVDLADASDSNKMPAFGIVAADPVGVNVDVVTFGTLKSINTSTYTDGDELYVDTTAGGLTATAPSGEGNLVQKIAKVVRADNSGNIKVMGAGRTNATPNLNDGNIFIGDSNNVATTASFATEVNNATAGKADLSGADFTGNVNIADFNELQFGASNDLRIYHNSNTNSSIIREQGTGSFQIQGNDLYLTDTNGGKYLVGVSGGFTKLYHNDSEKLETLTDGIKVTGDIAVSGTVNTNNIESTINTVDYPVYSTSLDGSNAIATLGGTDTGNKVHTLEMRPAEGGVRMHWHQNTDNINGQTLRFHTTDRGVHVGDDRTGTYTAGDNQNNADLDFGMLVGRESSNLGSNNFGFGYDVDFSVGTASNMGVGSLVDVLGTTSNSVAFGGDVKLGRFNAGMPDTGVTGSLVGGNIARTEGNYSFTWAKGELDSSGIYPALNKGYGCTLFGHVTEIDINCNWCLAGGDISSANTTTKIQNSDSSIVWGTGAKCIDSDSSAVFGYSNLVNSGDECLVSGRSNAVYLKGCVMGGSSNTIGKSGVTSTTGFHSACFGKSNLVEGDNNFISGKDNNSIGNSGACIGQSLKTPLFEPVGGGSYVWDDYSIVVGAYNDEAHKYYKNTNNTAWVEDHRFVVGTGTSTNAKDNGFIVAVPDSGFSGIIMPNLASSPEYTNDLNAKAGGVPVGGLYRDGNTVKIVLS